MSHDPTIEGAVQRAAKAAMRGVYWAGVAIVRRYLAWRGEPPYELRGHCSGCGACCEHPSIGLPRLLFHFRLLRRLIVAWQYHVNGWQFDHAERESRALVFRCLHYDPETRRCRNYATRPACCRDYPRLVLYETPPAFFDRCTHYPYSRDAEDVLAELDALDVPPEKVEELRRRFYVWEPPDSSDNSSR